MKSQVFLSYANEDIQMVRQLYSELVNRGVVVWFDKEHLRPGRWKPQITKAISRSRYFLICLSPAAIGKTGDKPGYQDEELSMAFEIALAQGDQGFTIVPVRLVECDRGDNRLIMFQQYDLFVNWADSVDGLAVLFGGRSLNNKVVERKLTKDDELIHGLAGKVIAFYYARDYERALNALNGVIALDPDNADAWNDKGLILRKLLRLDEGRAAFEKALSIKSPNSPLRPLYSGSVPNDKAVAAVKHILNSMDPKLQIISELLGAPNHVFDGIPITGECPSCGSSVMYCEWDTTREISQHYHDHYWHICADCCHIEYRDKIAEIDYNLQDELADPTHCLLCGRSLYEDQLLSSTDTDSI